MYMDVWSHVAQREREVITIESLWKTNVVKRSLKLTFLVTYYKISNAALKELLKAKVQLTALFWRVLEQPAWP